MDAPPERSTAREIVEGVVEAAVGMVPIAGNPLAVAFAMSVGWTYNRRMQAWHAQLAEAVTELQETVEGWPTFEELANDDVFVDAVVNAGRAAQATHQESKLFALRNGALNSIGSNAPTLDEQSRFFRLVDEFSRAHLRLLVILSDPTGAGLPEQGLLRRGGVRDLIHGLAEFEDSPVGWIDLLAKDLEAAGLTQFGPRV